MADRQGWVTLKLLKYGNVPKLTQTMLENVLININAK